MSLNFRMWPVTAKAADRWSSFEGCGCTGRRCYMCFCAAVLCLYPAPLSLPLFLASKCFVFQPHWAQSSLEFHSSRSLFIYFRFFISVCYLIIQSMHTIHCLLSQTPSLLRSTLIPAPPYKSSLRFCCFHFVLKPTRLNQAWFHGHGHAATHWRVGNSSDLSSMTETVTLPSVALKSQQFQRRSRAPWPWMNDVRPSRNATHAEQW